MLIKPCGLCKVDEVKGWGMDDLEAQEFFAFNTIGCWMGDGTPIFVHLFGE